MRKLIIALSIAYCLLGPAAGWADDTEVYGTTSVSVPPNVLIIFDTSGSMSTEDVPGEYYDPAITYPGTRTANAVYRYSSGSYTLFTNDVNNMQCADAKAALLSDGYVRANVRLNLTCGGSQKQLYLGNWLNYDKSTGGALRRRIDVAKEVVKQLITDTKNVRIGLMRFNNDQGGRVVRAIGPDNFDNPEDVVAHKQSLFDAIDGFTASGWTPLAETLAEAGLYYAGKPSWFNSGVSYTSPMQYRCQKNYIILMTDGEPTYDIDEKLWKGAYIKGDVIGDYDKDGKDPGTYGSNGSDYLDDVAKYLYVNDLNSSLGTAGDSFEVQNAITYTIGFQTQQQLLQDTATNGGGKYYTANSISGLAAAFKEILAEIADVNAVFVSPVVPVSRMNRVYAGNKIYIGFFKPENDGRWFGNIKKYGIGNHGELLDSKDIEATLPNGHIKDNAQSYWSTSADGPIVTKGGTGALLLDQATRNLYTYMGTQTDLGHVDNAFVTGNSLISTSVLDVEDAAQRETLINDIHGKDREWILGDILHSEPAVVHYGDTTIIFVGSNDGVMHCFNDSDGSELWGFIPNEHLSRLKNLSDSSPVHDYFIDGTPKVFEEGGKKVLFFGERRGGDTYYALDVTNYSAPKWLYKITPDMSGGAAGLGQSWGNATIGHIKTSASTSEKVLFLPGGYDINQDLETPASSDTVGRAIYAIKTADGTISNFNFNADTYSDMSHSIVDYTALEVDAGWAHRSLICTGPWGAGLCF
jgi:type IV pilus assembly protein PilY1